MLLELRVKDLGIIEDIEWNLDAGLNVITGETGAGKSLVIDAVELLLVGTASDNVIRHGANEARIEGVFRLPVGNKYAVLRAFLSEKGLTLEEELLIINCEIRKQKPGIVRINGHTVTKTILRQTGQLLVDIHGQSEHLSLLNKKYHLDFLDSFAHDLEIKEEFASRVTRLNEIEAELKSLTARNKETARQEEFLKYQIDEIKKASLQSGEDEELEKERHIMAHSEKLKTYSNQVYQDLYDSNSSHYSTAALTKLNEAVLALKKLVELDPALNQQLDYLEKAIYGLEEVARDVRTYGDKLNHDPERLEEMESRLELIRNLKRKYGNTVKDILNYQEKAEKELSGIGMSSERKAQLEKESTDLKIEMGKLGSKLSILRSQATQKLIERVKAELLDLEMSQMQFSVAITHSPSAEGITGPDGALCNFTNEGIDEVEFMVSTNPGEPLRPLAEIASTGETSRFTLALKSALSEADNIPVLIFDEIDIGVGGRSGDVLGKKLCSLARTHQVICVTHLPQIAAYADAHYCVHKTTADSRTTSTLEKLTPNLRINELAVMLAGVAYTETARKNARELLQKASGWKNPHQATEKSGQLGLEIPE